jgi:ubiquinone/menaquinone biosynthesis C-methylase UbiE
LQLPKTAAIIDVGGGNSKLVDFLLEEGFENISVLDISEEALYKTKQRLGKKAEKITWIVADIIMFKPTMLYDVWHDRATFHFLTEPTRINAYVSIAQQAIKKGGALIIATFSTEGPEKCSGLTVQRYNEQTLTETFQQAFEKVTCRRENHITPFGTTQNFLFCHFKRKEV